MLVSKKDELEALKKQQKDLIKKEVSVRREAKEEETLRSKMKKKFDQEKLKKLELELSQETKKQGKQSPTLSRMNSMAESHTSEIGYLKELSQLREIPEEEEFNAIKLRKVKEKYVNVPVYVRESSIRKAQKLPPPTYQKALKNGQVVTVHLLSESMPSHDPLIKTNAKVDREELEQMAKDMNLSSIKEAIAILQSQMNQSEEPPPKTKRTSSLSPKIRKQLKLDEPFAMPKVELENSFENLSPQARVQKYTFRDLPILNENKTSERAWINERMKQYSTRIKDLYLPPASLKKSVEMELMKDRSIAHKAPIPKRFHLNKI